MTEKPPKTRVNGIVILIIIAPLAICVFWVLSPLWSSRSATPTPFRNNVLIPPAAPSTRDVIYSVTGLDGATRASLTYTNEQGGTEQADVALPWRKVISVRQGQFVYISAQNQDASGGVACDIRVSMEAFKHSESRGAYVIASCSGSTP